MIRLIQQWSIRVGEMASAENIARDTVIKQGVIFLSATIVITLMPLIWGSLMLANGLRIPAMIYYAHSLFQIMVFLYGIRFRQYYAAAVLSEAILLLQPFLIQWTLGGFAASGAVVVWAIGVPLSAPFVFGRRRSAGWLAAYIVLLIISGIIEPHITEMALNVPEALTSLLFIGNIAGSISAFFVFVYMVVLQLDITQERADSLLLNILPATIADRLKYGEKVIADDISEASILFADIVDFTTMSAEASPTDVVEMLNSLFTEFDNLAEKHGLEKIKTIGDAYMVAGGLPLPRSDHAEAIMAMALDMLSVLERHQGINGVPLHLRIGISSGPVVAGVIGNHKFIYDIWGDTVNTASRMESNGMSNVIQVTPETYDRLKDRYTFEERAPILIKGKGEMVTYLFRTTNELPSLQ